MASSSLRWGRGINERDDVYQSSKYSPSFAVIDDKGKASFKILHHLISWVWAPVPQGPIRFNHEHGFIAPLRQPILPIQCAQVVQTPHE